jgi:hypothetical protein
MPLAIPGVENCSASTASLDCRTHLPPDVVHLLLQEASVRRVNVGEVGKTVVTPLALRELFVNDVE